jgi:hypothetical protein
MEPWHQLVAPDRTAAMAGSTMSSRSRNSGEPESPKQTTSSPFLTSCRGTSEFSKTFLIGPTRAMRLTSLPPPRSVCGPRPAVGFVPYSLVQLRP